MAVDLPCRYDKNTDWSVTDDVYYCDLNISLDIANTNTEFASLSGEHLNKSTNADVVGFRAYNKTLHYLPQGLEKYFRAEKIEFICIWSGGLKKIQQKDLSPFTKLKYFSVWLNDLIVIERNLFQFNPEIRYIELGRNRIKFIVGNVFSHLQHLQTLHLDGNICMSKDVSDNRLEVLELIKEIETRCRP